MMAQIVWGVSQLWMWIIVQQGLHQGVYKCEIFILILCVYLIVLLVPRTHNIPFWGVHNLHTTTPGGEADIAVTCLDAPDSINYK